MGVSENRGTPKSSILISCSIINHPFWGTPIFGNTHITLQETITYQLLVGNSNLPNRWMSHQFCLLRKARRGRAHWAVLVRSRVFQRKLAATLTSWAKCPKRREDYHSKWSNFSLKCKQKNPEDPHFFLWLKKVTRNARSNLNWSESCYFWVVFGETTHCDTSILSSWRYVTATPEEMKHLCFTTKKWSHDTVDGRNPIPNHRLDGAKTRNRK